MEAPRSALHGLGEIGSKVRRMLLDKEELCDRFDVGESVSLVLRARLSQTGELKPEKYAFVILIFG